jgi:hypothetical protein
VVCLSLMLCLRVRVWCIQSHFGGIEVFLPEVLGVQLSRSWSWLVRFIWSWCRWYVCWFWWWYVCCTFSTSWSIWVWERSQLWVLEGLRTTFSLSWCSYPSNEMWDDPPWWS